MQKGQSPVWGSWLLPGWITAFKAPALCSGTGKRIKILVVGEMSALAFIFVYFLLLFYSFLSRGVDLYALNFHLPL